MGPLRQFIKKLPFVASTAVRLFRRLRPAGEPGATRFDSRAYWERRYAEGGNSGAGSYGALAEFKADFLNAFVRRERVQSVIEFGCGDGAQLELAVYPRYVGLDVTRAAVKTCIEKNHQDPTRSFFLYDPNCYSDPAGVLRAELALSLDVVFHLVEDDVFNAYISHLFGASTRFVIIYSSDYEQPTSAQHVRHRSVSRLVAARYPSWRLVWREPQKYPDPSGNAGSFCDFLVFGKGE